MENDALIVIDMLNDFIDEKGALYCGATARAIVPFVRGRITFYTQNRNPVIYLQDAHDKGDLEFEKFPEHCVAGTWGNAIIPELTPGPDTLIVPKKRFSGFFGTGLERVLKDAGVRAVEVVGVCTSICVMDTVGGLTDRDYPVTVPVAGVADFDAEFHCFALKRMKQVYGAHVS